MEINNLGRTEAAAERKSYSPPKIEVLQAKDVATGGVSLPQDGTLPDGTGTLSS